MYLFYTIYNIFLAMAPKVHLISFMLIDSKTLFSWNLHWWPSGQ